MRSLLRIVVGPVRFRICAGLAHRLNCILTVSSSYEYAPYYTPKPKLSKHELLPPSEDDFDALNENISMSVMQFTVVAPIIEFHLFDHPYFQSTKEQLFRKRKVSVMTNMIFNVLKIIFSLKEDIDGYSTILDFLHAQVYFRNTMHRCTDTETNIHKEISAYRLSIT